MASARITITSGVISENKKDGFSTITKLPDAGGMFQFTFSSPQPDSNYIVVATRTRPASSEGDVVVTDQTTSSFVLKNSNDNNFPEDPPGLNVIVVNY